VERIARRLEVGLAQHAQRVDHGGGRLGQRGGLQQEAEQQRQQSLQVSNALQERKQQAVALSSDLRATNTQLEALNQQIKALQAQQVNPELSLPATSAAPASTAATPAPGSAPAAAMPEQPAHH
jgi:hypothetical protein